MPKRLRCANSGQSRRLTSDAAAALVTHDRSRQATRVVARCFSWQPVAIAVLEDLVHDPQFGIRSRTPIVAVSAVESLERVRRK